MMGSVGLGVAALKDVQKLLIPTSKTSTLITLLVKSPALINKAKEIATQYSEIIKNVSEVYESKNSGIDVNESK